MSELIENSYKNLELLAVWYEQNAANRNEATTRSQLIDRLFYDCLAWDRIDITCEDHQGGVYCDYTFHFTRKIMIAEAKREGDYFDIPVDWQSKVYNIKTLTRGNKNLDDAIQQVMHYCALQGVSYAMVTNGHQVIVFKAISTIPLYERKTLVFSSLKHIKEDFHLFWQTLSKPSFTTNILSELLQGKTERQLPLKLSAKIVNYPKSQIRNQSQADLQILSELILEDIVHTAEHEKEFLEECYCPSGALSQFSLLSKDILEKRYHSLYPDEGSGPLTQSATTKKGISEELLAETFSRRPILIIGDVGVGKTTFIKKLIKIDAPEIFNASICIYADFGRQATLSESIKGFFLKEVSKQLKEVYGFDINNRDFIRRVYRKEIEEFASSIYGDLKEVSPETYKLKEIEMLTALLENTPEHIKTCLKLLSKEHHKQIIIILDNADQRNNEIQQEIFLISEEVSNSWSATVFVTLRPETFNISKQKGALSGYHAKAFTISPPRIDKVIEKRLNYALKFASGELQPKSLNQNTSFNSVNLQKLIKVFLYTISEKEDIIEFLDNITAGNVREALDIVRLFFGSGHVDTKKIIDIYDEQGFYTIALHEFLRAVIYGDTHYYDPDHSIILNLFDISTFDQKEHFLLPLILGLLSSLPSPHLDSGFVSTEILYEHTQALGYIPEQIDKSLFRAIDKKLIETNARLKPDQDFIPTAYRVTSKGAYHFSILCKEFTYIDAIIIDTPILSETFHQVITDVNDIDERIVRVRNFKAYLDQCWSYANFSNTTFDWHQMSTDLNNDIEKVTFRVKRRKELNAINRKQ